MPARDAEITTDQVESSFPINLKDFYEHLRRHRVRYFSSTETIWNSIFNYICFGGSDYLLVLELKKSILFMKTRPRGGYVRAVKDIGA